MRRALILAWASSFFNFLRFVLSASLEEIVINSLIKRWV
jgi:hypothetical protein